MRVRDRFFGDASRSLDRFGMLLAFTIAGVAGLSLIDLESIPDDVVRGLAALIMSVPPTNKVRALGFIAAEPMTGRSR